MLFRCCTGSLNAPEMSAVTADDEPDVTHVSVLAEANDRETWNPLFGSAHYCILRGRTCWWARTRYRRWRNEFTLIPAPAPTQSPPTLRLYLVLALFWSFRQCGNLALWISLTSWVGPYLTAQRKSPNKRLILDAMKLQARLQARNVHYGCRKKHQTSWITRNISNSLQFPEWVIRVSWLW